jgi:hypothetical protein
MMSNAPMQGLNAHVAASKRYTVDDGTAADSRGAYSSNCGGLASAPGFNAPAFNASAEVLHASSGAFIVQHDSNKPQSQKDVQAAAVQAQEPGQTEEGAVENLARRAVSTEGEQDVDQQRDGGADGQGTDIVHAAPAVNRIQSQSLVGPRHQPKKKKKSRMTAKQASSAAARTVPRRTTEAQRNIASIE